MIYFSLIEIYKEGTVKKTWNKLVNSFPFLENRNTDIISNQGVIQTWVNLSELNT